MLVEAKKLLFDIVKIKKHEHLIILTDRDKCRIVEAVKNIAKSALIKHIVVKVSKNRNHSEAIPELKELFLETDVVIAIMNKSITHCPETYTARKHGTRFVSMINVNEKMFKYAMKAKQHVISKICKKIKNQMEKADEVHVISKYRKKTCKLIVEVEKSLIKIDDGDASKYGSLINLPFGEVFIAPLNSANGKFRIDSCSHMKNIGYVELENNKIVSHKNCASLLKYLKSLNDKNALSVVEFGIGTNPWHEKIKHNIIYDEKIFKSSHIAFGGFGLLRKSKIHEDVVCLKPKIFINIKNTIKKLKFE